MPDPRETLARIRAQADAATDGPWTAEYSGEQGNCVLPPGYRSTREAVAVTRLWRAQADAEFIAASRTTVPALLDLADAVLERHVKAQPIPAAHGTHEGGDYCAACAEDWPCPDYTAATTALEGLHHD